MILSAKQFKDQTKSIPKTKSLSGRLPLVFAGVKVKVKYSRRMRTLIHSLCPCSGCGATFSHLELSKRYQPSMTKGPILVVRPVGIRPDGTKVELNCDHIVPQNLGGESHSDNLQVMCVECNVKKGSLLPSEILLGKSWWKKTDLIENEVGDIK